MSQTPVVIHKGRTNVVTVGLGYDVSGDVLVSEIRTEKDVTSDLLATWTITFLTDGTDGELILTLDNSLSSALPKVNAFMDIKRVTGGEPVSVFDEPVPVAIKGVVTA